MGGGWVGAARARARVCVCVCVCVCERERERGFTAIPLPEVWSSVADTMRTVPPMQVTVTILQSK